MIHFPTSQQQTVSELHVERYVYQCVCIMGFFHVAEFNFMVKFGSGFLQFCSWYNYF